VATTIEERQRTTEEELARQARRKELLTRWFWRIMGYVFFLGGWEFLTGRVLEEALIPGPIRVFQTFLELWASGKILPAFGSTLVRLFTAFALSFLVGSLLGVISQNRWWDGFFKDATMVSLTAPGLIWVLITAIIFGNRIWGPMIAIILTTFGLVTVNVYEGVKSLPKDLIDMGKAFHVSNFASQRNIVLPHLAPFLFTGLRFGFSIAWKVTVLTEVFSSSSGVGFEMRVAQQLFQNDELLTWILIFFVFALFLEKVVLQAFENRYFRWRQAVQAA
jgi:NitT/TauT family transport system permease protein